VSGRVGSEGEGAWESMVLYSSRHLGTCPQSTLCSNSNVPPTVLKWSRTSTKERLEFNWAQLFE